MAGLRIFAALSIALACCVLQSNAAPADNCAEACWEKCFQKVNTEEERYREVWDNLLEIILEINYLKNLYNVSKVGFLYDTAMSSRHNQLENPNTGNLENGHNTFHVYFLLLQAIMLAVNGQKNYVVQYNEETAWTCDQMNCMDMTACQSIAAVQYMVPIQLNPTSHCPGAIEAACKLLNNKMTDVTCASAANDNRMVIAIANGDFNINDPFRRRRNSRHHSSSGSSSSSSSSSSESWEEDNICPPFRWGGLDGSSSSGASDERDFFSPCHSYFDTRYVIGTHTAKRETMELFTSKHGNYRYFHDEEFTLNALNDLVWCMTRTTSCCATTVAPVLSTCSQTQGPFGELINNYSTHPGIAASSATPKAPIIPYPVDPAGGAVMINLSG